MAITGYIEICGTSYITMTEHNSVVAILRADLERWQRAANENLHACQAKNMEMIGLRKELEVMTKERDALKGKEGKT